METRCKERPKRRKGKNAFKPKIFWNVQDIFIDVENDVQGVTLRRRIEVHWRNKQNWHGPCYKIKDEKTATYAAHTTRVYCGCQRCGAAVVPSSFLRDPSARLGDESLSEIQSQLSLLNWILCFAYLVFSSLELVEDGLRFRSDVEFWRIVHQEDDVSSVNEPLAGIVEGEHPLDLFSDLQDAGNLDNVDLRAHQLT